MDLDAFATDLNRRHGAAVDEVLGAAEPTGPPTCRDPATILVTRDSACVSDLPGAFSSGESRRDARDHVLNDALQLGRRDAVARLDRDPLHDGREVPGQLLHLIPLGEGRQGLHNASAQGLPPCRSISRQGGVIGMAGDEATRDHAAAFVLSARHVGYSPLQK